jgi:tyrosinase
LTRIRRDVWTVTRAEGIEGRPGRADTSDPLWSNCQHGSWFFLAWHRMYLRAFD